LLTQSSGLPACAQFELPGDLNHTTDTVIYERTSLIATVQPKSVRAGGTMIKMKQKTANNWFSRNTLSVHRSGSWDFLR
jgi:hypothetical protein